MRNSLSLTVALPRDAGPTKTSRRMSLYGGLLHTFSASKRPDIFVRSAFHDGLRPGAHRLPRQRKT